MLKWQKPQKSRKEIRLSEIGKELDFIEMQIQNPKLLRAVLISLWWDGDCFKMYGP